MSAVNVRLPDSLHKAVREMAKRDNVSINQFITLAIAEKISALMTEDYITQRGERASRAKYEAVLDKIPDVPPPDYDRIDDPE